MLPIFATEAWRSAHPGAIIGLLEMSGVNIFCSPASLDKRKRELEAILRERYQGFTRQDFLALPVMAAYNQYYKRFGKTYHVLLQVESIALKGKHLPTVSPMVDACFIAEVDTLILTAGHDAAKLVPPIYMDVSRPEETMTTMNGEMKSLYTGDMIMRDKRAICCSIIYGQDNHSPISSGTDHALYVAYIPSGISPTIVESHFGKIEDNIRIFSPNAHREQMMLV